MTYETPSSSDPDFEVADMREHFDQSARLIRSEERRPEFGSSRVPLLFQQRWLWGVLQQYPAWHCTLCTALRVRGALDIEALRRSFEEVIRRHGALRTRIVSVNNEPWQQIEDRAGYELELVGKEQLASPLEEAVDLFVQRCTRKPFKVDGGALWRIWLGCCGPEEHVLVVSMHHIITDGFSFTLLFRELWRMYASVVRGEAMGPPLTDDRQYARYALWQQETADGWCALHEPYWAGRLGGAQRLRVPVDRQVQGAQAVGLGLVNMEFGRALSVAVRDISKREQTLPAMVALAGYAVAAAKWSKQLDFVVAFNVSGRHRPEHTVMMGYFAHAIYLRVQVRDGESFSKLLQRLSVEFRRAVLHQDSGRLMMRAPELLAGTFWQWLPWNADELAGVPSSDVAQKLTGHIAVERIPFEMSMTEAPQIVDIGVALFEGDEINATLSYRADLFSAKRIERFAQDVRYLLEWCVEHSAESLGVIVPANSR